MVSSGAQYPAMISGIDGDALAPRASTRLRRGVEIPPWPCSVAADVETWNSGFNCTRYLPARARCPPRRSTKSYHRRSFPRACWLEPPTPLGAGRRRAHGAPEHPESPGRPAPSREASKSAGVASTNAVACMRHAGQCQCAYARLGTAAVTASATDVAALSPRAN